MTVFVRTPVGELQLQLEQDTPASVLYTEVERHTGIPASDYKILYQGKWPVRCLSNISLVICISYSVRRSVHFCLFQTKL